jgi:hypothetical protein
VAIAPSVVELWKGRAPGPAGEGEEVGPLDLPAGPNFLAFFEDRALGVQWAQGRGDLALAGELLHEMRETFAAADSELIHVRLGALDGALAYDEGDYERSAGLLREACVELGRLGLKPELWQTMRMRGWCAARLGWSQQEQELSRRAQGMLAELAGSLPPAARAIYLLNKWTVEERALAAEINHLVRLKADLAGAPWYRRPWRRWVLWRALGAFLHSLDRARRSLAARQVGLAPAADEPPPSTWRRLWGHPRRRATLSFLVLPDRVFACRAGRLSLDFAVSPLTRLRTRELVARWHKAVAREDERDAAEASRELAAGLGLPDLLASLPRSVRRLTVVPDDSLHGFPFAACAVNGRYLAETHALAVGFERTPIARRHGPPGPALTLAVTRGAEGVPPLPETAAEVEQVGRWLKERGIVVRELVDEGGRAEVLGHWREAGFVHAACHGVFRPDEPDASGLVLVPRPGVVEVLSLRDLGGLDLSGLRHATLSSCWGADNFVLPGRWIVSLPETLCRAGAGSVLACLWPVDDEVGRAFSARFYHHLARLPRDLALRATRIDCLNDNLGLPGKRPTADPFYWAGYQLYGEPGPLELGGRS